MGGTSPLSSGLGGSSQSGHETLFRQHHAQVLLRPSAVRAGGILIKIIKPLKYRVSRWLAFRPLRKHPETLTLAWVRG